MPAVLVHGVPDTAAVWDPLRAHLDRDDVVTVALPGFGTPRPAGFTATKEAYVEWLTAELGRIATETGAPIDLVGHDWGSILVVRVASVGEVPLRTWAAGGGPVDRTYVWHDTAQLWQTPEVGEQVMAGLTPEALAPGLVATGLSEADAARTAAAVDDTMKGCILELYRSAVHVGDEWEDDLASTTAPGLVVWGERDPFAAVEFGERLAERTGAALARIDSGHWWQLERPAEVAAALTDHWS